RPRTPRPAISPAGRGGGRRPPAGPPPAPGSPRTPQGPDPLGRPPSPNRERRRELTVPRHDIRPPTLFRPSPIPPAHPLSVKHFSETAQALFLVPPTADEKGAGPVPGTEVDPVVWTKKKRSFAPPPSGPHGLTLRLLGGLIGPRRLDLIAALRGGTPQRPGET